jgi:hypothetical protein
MAVKTFTTGEVLTSADTNTYLANSGLVYITSQTIGTAVSSVTVSNCFSSTYDNYVVTTTSILSSVSSVRMQMQFSGVTSGYYGSQFYDLYTGADTNYNRMNNAGSWYFLLGGTDGATSSTTTLYSPNKTTFHFMTGQFYGSGYTGWCAGQTTNATAQTGLVISPISGTMTGGTITVYGYRKA